MYYYAIVDCDKNMKALMDAGYYGKVEFNTHASDSEGFENEFSYEK